MKDLGDIKTLTSDETKQRDQQVWLAPEGDATFSPAHNRAVVDRTIMKYEAMVESRKRAYTEQVAERSDAIVSYLRSNAANAGKPIEQYISEKELARLRGERRVEKIKTLMNGQKYIEFEEI